MPRTRSDYKLDTEVQFMEPFASLDTTNFQLNEFGGAKIYSHMGLGYRDGLVGMEM